MEYLEDFLSEEMIDDLTFEIAKVLDDDKYIDSTLSAFENDEQAMQLLNFIRNKPNITRVDIDLKTIEIFNASHNVK